MGTTGVVVGRLHEHALARTKPPSITDLLESTTVRPKIIDFISKIKKRSADLPKTENKIDRKNPTEDLIEEIDDSDCPCSANIREGIAEHSIAEGDIKEKTTTITHELNVGMKRKRNTVNDENSNSTTPKNDEAKSSTNVESADVCSNCGEQTTTKQSPETCSRDTCARV